MVLQAYRRKGVEGVCTLYFPLAGPCVGVSLMRPVQWAVIDGADWEADCAVSHLNYRDYTCMVGLVISLTFPG